MNPNEHPSAATVPETPVVPIAPIVEPSAREPDLATAIAAGLA